MKSLGLKGVLAIAGLAAGLILCPACKAQSEIAPDHFDGTDFWETRVRKVHALKHKPTAERLNRSRTSPRPGHSLERVAKQNGSVPVRPTSPLAVNRKKQVSVSANKP